MHPNRRAGAIAVCLLLVLAACSGSSSSTIPDLPADPCRDLTVSPGAGGIAWTVTAAGEHGLMDSDPVGVGDGFLVGVNRCIGFVETGGRLRWTVPGSLVDAARLVDTLVIAQHGESSVLGVDARTGEVIWKRPDRALWSDVVAEGRTTMLVGTSFDGSVTTIEASTGRATANQYGILPNDGRFLNAIVDDGLLLTAGHAGRKGRVVAADVSGRACSTPSQVSSFPILSPSWATSSCSAPAASPVGESTLSPRTIWSATIGRREHSVGGGCFRACRPVLQWRWRASWSSG